VAQGSTVLLCNPGAPTALARILFEDSWSEIGKVTTTYKEEPAKTSATVYSSGPQVIVLIDSSLKSTYCGPIMAQLWPILSAKGCKYVGIKTIYKTNYSTFEGHSTIDADRPLPLRFKRSSISACFDAFLSSASKFDGHVLADNQLNPTGGLAAAFLMHAEMYGQAAMTITAIIDQHFITSETLQAFDGVVNTLLGHKFDFTEIYKAKQFKPILKELNQ